MKKELLTRSNDNICKAAVFLLVVTRSDTEAKTGFEMIFEAPPTQEALY